jgi:tRNA A-37 threonylcarbamoyl transferase component Bud32
MGPKSGRWRATAGGSADSPIKLTLRRKGPGWAAVARASRPSTAKSVKLALRREGQRWEPFVRETPGLQRQHPFAVPAGRPPVRRSAAHLSRPSAASRSSRVEVATRASALGRGEYAEAVARARAFVAPIPYDLGRFETERVLGEGSYGQAALVRDRVNGRQLVMKRMNKAAIDLDTVSLELDALRQLKSICGTYVVCYDGFFEDQNDYYLLSEYLGDQVTTLADYIRNPPSFPTVTATIRRKVKIANNLVHGLEVVHGAGIAHRDLKPANVLVNRKTGEIWYIDFGLACWAGECEQVFTTGTVCFAAPELVEYADAVGRSTGKPDPGWHLADYQRADLFAVGQIIRSLMLNKGGCPSTSAGKTRRADLTARLYGGPDVAALTRPYGWRDASWIVDAEEG